MDRVVAGVQKFLKEIAPNKQEEFRALALGQKPEILFITCSDSRIVPGMILQSVPGLVFVVRNAGNIVPPSGATISGETATIEYAIRALNIKNIVVCGHTNCGAMQGLLDRASVATMPLVDQWLGYAESSLEKCKARKPGDPVDLSRLVRENVLMQLENLKTHAFIKEAINAGNLTLHGWVFEIETGRMLRYDAQTDEFTPLDSDDSSGSSAAASLA